ncbi:MULTISPECIES: DMT family transporter [Peptoniphilus]|uniref:DMT family transporter n=1 Tax=Peptoniphilus TaxID=162289 RepID=UPI0001DC9E6E|nr:DMT family transporter [Peptoniphilus sp. oral taxon 836]EFK38754.1 putative membrane protein [Peptoniphilus sp. oral taxon 836 str. F0141]
MSRELKSTIMLLNAAIIWGFAYVVQVLAMNYIGPFTFNFARFFIGWIFLIIIYSIFKKTIPYYKNEIFSLRNTIKYGIICGLLITVGNSLQQVALLGTTTGKVGFLTSTYIVIIPIIQFFLGNRVSKKIIFCIGVATLGVYLLSIKGNFSINRYDGFVLISVLFFAVHIMIMASLPDDCEKILVSMIQFIVISTFSLIIALIFENIIIRDIFAAYKEILFIGIISSGVAYTLQMIAFKEIDPTIGSLVASLESVFAVLGGWVFLNQRMNLREISGCVIILIATVVAQLPSKGKTKGLSKG